MRIFEAFLADEADLPAGEVVDITSRNGKIILSILCEDVDYVTNHDNYITRRFVMNQSDNFRAPENSRFLATRQFGKNKAWVYIWELDYYNPEDGSSEYDFLVDAMDAQLQVVRDEMAEHMGEYHSTPVSYDITPTEATQPQSSVNDEAAYVEAPPPNSVEESKDVQS